MYIHTILYGNSRTLGCRHHADKRGKGPGKRSETFRTGWPCRYTSFRDFILTTSCKNSFLFRLSAWVYCIDILKLYQSLTCMHISACVVLFNIHTMIPNICYQYTFTVNVMHVMGGCISKTFCNVLYRLECSISLLFIHLFIILLYLFVYYYYYYYHIYLLIFLCARLCIYLVVVYRAWATLVWSCFRIYIWPVFPSVDVHSLPLSPLPSVHSKYLYFFGENCTFFYHSSKFLFTIFSCPLKHPASPFLLNITFFLLSPGCSSIYKL